MIDIPSSTRLLHIQSMAVTSIRISTSDFSDEYIDQINSNNASTTNWSATLSLNYLIFFFSRQVSQETLQPRLHSLLVSEKWPSQIEHHHLVHGQILWNRIFFFSFIFEETLIIAYLRPSSDTISCDLRIPSNWHFIWPCVPAYQSLD